ncbi:MAG: DoxX family protein, partial [Planctomycetes bacterium]|nr:DoxX family protein [Planctomycetota bacterium]
RLRSLLAGDPDRAGQILEGQKGTVDYHWPGDLDKYQHRLERYRRLADQAETAFQQDHLEYDWNEIQALRAELVGPVKALDEELRRAAETTFGKRRSLVTGKTFDRILTDEQRLAADMSWRGPMSDQWRRIDIIDWLTIWSLVVLGTLLIIGLATRAAAVLGACMLLSFYLAWPPWPGVPEAPGTEHALFVNKNFIEALMLFALAALPTGTWFGVDGVIYRLFSRWRTNGESV